MNLQDIEQLVNDYECQLNEEYAVKAALVERQNAAEYAKVITLLAAYSDGVIDGKNADMRKLQEAAVVGESESIGEIEHAVKALAQRVALEENTSKALEAQIGLTKAWLYSQSGK